MARYFDGSSTYLTVADDAALTLPDAAYTVAGWMATDSDDWDHLGAILSWNYYDYTPNFNLRIRGGTCGWQPNALHFGSKDGDGDGFHVYTTDYEVGATTAWQHVLLRRTASGDISIIVDGTVRGSGSNADYDDVNYSGSWYFGRPKILPTDKYFRGSLAEWAKWDAELSTEQITALANGVRPPEVGTRPAWYMPMLAGLEEEIAGLTVTNNGTTVSEHPPKIVGAGQYI